MSGRRQGSMRGAKRGAVALAVVALAACSSEGSEPDADWIESCMRTTEKLVPVDTTDDALRRFCECVVETPEDSQTDPTIRCRGELL